MRFVGEDMQNSFHQRRKKLMMGSKYFHLNYSVFCFHHSTLFSYTVVFSEKTWYSWYRKTHTFLAFSNHQNACVSICICVGIKINHRSSLTIPIKFCICNGTSWIDVNTSKYTQYQKWFGIANKLDVGRK